MPGNKEFSMIFRITMNLGLKIYQRKKPDFCWNPTAIPFSKSKIITFRGGPCFTEPGRYNI